MTQLAERLSDLATTGTHAITFEDIGLPADTVCDQVPEVAAGPLAPSWPKRSFTPTTPQMVHGSRQPPRFPQGLPGRAASWP